MRTKTIGVLGAAVTVWAASHTRAECPTIDFEGLAAGTVVTNQFPGVTFSAPNNSCGGSPLIFPVIVSPLGGTSSGTRALAVQNGCPGFNPDFIRIVFAEGHSEMSFRLGPEGDFLIRAYTTPSPPAPPGVDLPFHEELISISGMTTPVHRLVTIVRPQGNMRRVEIRETDSFHEYIDDLRYRVDATPPTAVMTAPNWDACVCGIVPIQGMACDDNGAYGFDRLEYQPQSAAVTDPWTLIGQFVTPLCAGGTLYSWDTADVPHGDYKLRLTVENACGLRAQDWLEVRVQKEVPAADIRQPAANAVRAGQVVVDGSVVFPGFRQCFDHYRVQYRPVSGGAFQHVNPATPLYFDPIETDPLAVWDTASGPAAVPDGNYRIRVLTTDVCGVNSPPALRDIFVDNTPPTAEIDSPLMCAFVDGSVQILGTATDNHFDRYTLQYIGGDADTWTDIVDSETTVPVVNGTLGLWDTTGLPSCSYVIRLRVISQAITAAGDPVISDAFVTVIAGDFCPIDLDGDLDEDLADFAQFQNCFDGPMP